MQVRQTRIRTVDISPEVEAVLRAGTWAESVFRLPPGQLDRGLYQQVDRVLRALGGKWQRQAGGHTFASNAAEDLRSALESGEAVDRKRTLEQFFTPPEIAAKVIEAADFDLGGHVLEPSAGNGALIAAALAAGAEFITAVEIDPELAEGLAGELRERHGCGVWVADFLKWKPVAKAPINCVLMNPPFGQGADMAHVRRAFEFLAPDGRLVAIMSPHWTFAADRASVDFRQWVSSLGGDWTELPQGSFSGSGTGVSSGILVLDRPGSI